MIRRALLVASLALLGCGAVTELPGADSSDPWSDQPELCPLDEDCEGSSAPIEIVVVGDDSGDSDGGAP